MKKFADGERSPRTNDLVQLTNPHLFLGNTDFNHASVFTLGDKLCLDDCLDDFRRESSPYRVWVIDETHCRCGTCDLAWMFDGWHCPQIWDTETSGSSDDDLSMHSWSSIFARDEDELMEGTSSLEEATVLSISGSDGEAMKTKRVMMPVKAMKYKKTMKNNTSVRGNRAKCKAMKTMKAMKA